MSRVFDSEHGRILCIADIRGRLSALNDLAKEADAVAIVHTGDFGFFEDTSLDRITDRTLRHLTMYSPLIPPAQRTSLLSADSQQSIRAAVNVSLLSEFPLLLSGRLSLNVPVYTVCGACEDVLILEKFRSGAYSIPNLHIIDEATSHLIDIAGLKLRLLGIGGALVPHKMFDNGDANATIAGGQGTMWLTTLQLGELVDTAQRVFDPSETRLLVTHASPGREGIISQLALVTKADLTISAGLHFRYSTSWNEFSVQADYDGLRHKLLAGKDHFDKVWESVKTQVDAVIDDNQRVLLNKALSVVERIPSATGTNNPQDEAAWKNCWNWNLCDAAYGSLILDLNQGRVSAELKSQGFNYAYRRSATVPATPTSAVPGVSLPAPSQAAGVKTPVAPPSKSATPAPPAAAAGSAPGSTKPADRPLPPHMSNGATPAPATGTGSLTPSSDIQDSTKSNDRKKKDKKDRKDRDKSASGPGTGTGTPSTAGGISHKPNPSTTSTTSTPAPDSAKSPISGTLSPSIGPSGSTGTRTPRTSKSARNPWTLFFRLTVPTSEASLRAFFGPAASGITRITFPTTTSAGRAQKLAYVEFGDEEGMQKGLQEKAELLDGAVPEVKIAQDRETREREMREMRERGRETKDKEQKEGEGEGASSGSTPASNANSGSNTGSGYRGRGRGRGRGGSGDGGRGGGFASRGLAMAGLTKGGRGGGPASGGNGAGAGSDA